MKECELIRTAFTGFLAVGSFGSFIAFIVFNLKSQTFTQLSYLNSVLSNKAQHCNKIFFESFSLQGLSFKDESWEWVSEIIISIQLCDKILNTSNERVKKRRGEILSAFWLQLKPSLRHTIITKSNDIKLINPDIDSKIYWDQFLTITSTFKKEIEQDIANRKTIDKKLKQ